MAMTSRFTLASPAFESGAQVPVRCTCDGQNESPPLTWHGAPDRTRSFALIVDDPDAPDPAAPTEAWVHWVVYNIPASEFHLRAGAAKLGMPEGALPGRNDWNRAGYGGPCPPRGKHRYCHTLYALDTVLPDLHEPTRAKLEAAMKGHIVARAHLMGTYQRRGRSVAPEVSRATRSSG
jgi:Raf kinase inhibitor-like YbhB/YbcL family protein